MAHILSVTNHKGGVGKTTTTINLGAGLRERGQRVLLIDLDPQANLTTSLGLYDREGKTLYEALKGEEHLFGVVANVRHHLAVLPASMDLSSLEVELSTVAGREYILSELLESILVNYDFILIDCPPSLGILTLNALSASHALILTLQAEYLALQGLNKLEDTLKLIQKRINPQLTILGVLVTLYDNRKNLHRTTVDSVRERFGEKVFETQIRDNITLAEAPRAGKDIFSYDRNCNGARDYLAMADEVLKRFGIEIADLNT